MHMFQEEFVIVDFNIENLSIFQKKMDLESVKWWLFVPHYLWILERNQVEKDYQLVVLLSQMDHLYQ